MLTFLNLGKNGRLGNQMFQIAATIGVALKNRQPYSFPNWKCYHSGNVYSNRYNKNLPILEKNKEIITINESQFNYKDIVIDDVNKLYTLNGYFQTEKYFKEYRDLIKEYFTLSPERMNPILDRYSDILDNSCSLHIRRGDYMTQTSHHPIQSIDYYYEAINVIYGDNFENVNFLIFSDDINWCKNNIKLNKVHFIEGNDNITDLYLMSKCDNNIIANSSFSWWGAWLNDNKDKKVVGPKKWFGPSLSHYNTEDIIPEEWIKI